MRRLPRGFTWAENGTIRIQKVVHIQGFKRTVRCRTKTSSIREAERFYEQELARIRQSLEPVEKTFAEASMEYARTQTHLSNYAGNVKVLAEVVERIGDLPLTRVYDGTLEPVVRVWHARGLKPKSINLSLEIIRRVLTLAARTGRD